MIKNMILLIALSVMCLQLVQSTSGYGQLRVYSPFSGNSESFEYSIANFGLIPYGITLSGPLAVPKEEKLGCKSFGNYVKRDGENKDDRDDEEQDEATFMIIERGECDFTIKAMNAQAAGAKLIIIYDDVVKEDIHNVILADDGQGDNVTIPTVFISYDDGQKLLDFIASNEKENSYFHMQNHQLDVTTSDIRGTISFNVMQTETVDVKFFINPPFIKNFELLNSYFKNYSYVASNVNFTPVYQIFGVPKHISQHHENDSTLKSKKDKIQQKFNKINNAKNCIRKDRYCALDMDFQNVGTGAQVVEEYLFQICLQKVKGDQVWFEYVKIQHEKCFEVPYWNTCTREKLRKESQITPEQNTQIKACMYPDGKDKDYDAELEVLEKNLQIIKYSSVDYYPSVTLNNEKYRGSIEGGDVLEATCAYIKNSSKDCQNLLKQVEQELNHEVEQVNVVLIITVVVIVLVLFFFIMIFIYKRMVTQEINKEMNIEINTMVQSYMAFHEQKDSSRLN